MAINGFLVIEPVGYLEMIALLSNSRMIITDSGGLSKESYFAGVKCLYMLDIDVWEDLDNIGWIRKMSMDNYFNVKIINESFDMQIQERKCSNETFYGNGYAAQKIVDLMEQICTK